MPSLRCNDVSEVYSPPRAVRFAKDLELAEGWGLDFTTVGKQGESWDLSKAEVREKALKFIKKDKPVLVIGSPTCTICSIMMNPNLAKVGQQEKDGRSREIMVHMTFRLKVYKLQHHEERHLLHEHLLSTTSRRETGMINLAGIKAMIKTNAHMCRFGMAQMTDQGPRPIRKPIGFLIWFALHC